MDDITLLQPELDTGELETIPPALAPHAAEAATDAPATEATDDHDDRALVDRPVDDVEVVLRWAREATCIGLDGPPDPGTLPGVMAFKRPPPSQFVPRGDGSPMAAPRPDISE